MKRLAVIGICALALGCGSSGGNTSGGGGADAGGTTGNTTGDGDTTGTTGGDTTGTTGGDAGTTGGDTTGTTGGDTGGDTTGTCTPNCDGKTCGDDGCGDSCGDCADGETCNTAGACEPIGGGGGDCGTCANDTVCGAGGDGVNPQWCASGNCGGVSYEGECQGDIVLFCDNDTLFSIDCAFLSEGANSCTMNADQGYFDCAAAPQCDNKDCGDDGAGGSCGECGQDQMCSADGKCEACTWQCDGKSCGDNGCGGVCGTCDEGTLCDADGMCLATADIAGNTCAKAIVIAAASSAQGDTNIASGDFQAEADECDGLGSAGAGSNDHVYAFTPDAAGVYTIDAEGFDLALYVATSCEAITGNCIKGSDAVGDTESLFFAAEAGTTYYIVVDGWSSTSNVAGAYTLSLSEPCTPACDGKTCGSDGCGGTCGECGEGTLCDTDFSCADAATVGGNLCGNTFSVDALPFEGQGDTGNATNGYSVGADTCMAETGGSSPEQIWTFSAAADAIYSISAGDKHTVFVTDACPALPAGVTSLPLSCVAGATGETVYATLTGGTDYNVFVDGGAGAYTLNIDVCTPDCADKNCGSDGCGGTCGECSGDTPECSPEQTCQACQPKCEGLTCGDDGCGGTCGECAEGEGCVEGACAAGATCAGACGSADQTAGGCYCDDQCFQFGDCCDDICNVCSADFTDLCAQ